MKKTNFSGVGTALVTPFTKGGQVDLMALAKIVAHQIKGKIDYLVILGTTGESVTLSSDEKDAVIKTVIESSKGRVPLVLGVGGNNTMEVTRYLEKIDFHGIDAILSVTPYYNKPNQNGLYAHYKAVSKASSLPVILYNVPGRTGCNMLPDTTIRLANEFENIVAIKEASGSIEQIMKIIGNKPSKFQVISGDDPITLPLMSAGASGVISVVSNAFPKLLSDMVRFCSSNEWDKARKIHYKLYDIIPLLFAEGSPGGIKVILNSMGLCENRLRLPLYPVSKNLEVALISQTKKVLGK